ncbi:MAG: tRNA pseudouridine(55) synthase TruB [Hyphomicrobiaceae bacterium]|nr:tRNA pseudouridine(55) synthase TruB [Hyphomicrobiaceae bacterium]
MSRRKKGNPINGWIILDKPVGMTSTQAVGKVRWLYQAQKAGHAGTLDPLATGVLPIALGEATKTVPYAVDGVKAYEFTVRWGAETDTDDAEGRVVETSEHRPTPEQIEAILPGFHGEILQTPPQYSAIKIQGERAYDLARSGETVKLEPRPVIIDRLELIAMPDEHTSIFEAECGRGTYVRALARDMGRQLGCLGHVTQLRRTRVAAFDVESAVTVAELEAAHDAEDGGAALARYLKPIELALSDLLEVSVSPPDAARLARGQSILVRGRDAPITSGEAFAVCKGTLVAICEMDKGEMVPVRVFSYR